MRIAGIEDTSLVNGEGVRMTIFTSGCIHNCEGCHNPEMQEYFFGEEIENETILQRIKDKLKWIDGLTLSGGDPLFQLSATKELLQAIRNDDELKDINIWLYTGYLFEDIPKSILKNVDVIIDGKYDKSLPEGKYRGSINQKIMIKYPGTNKFTKRVYGDDISAINRQRNINNRLYE